MNLDGAPGETTGERQQRSAALAESLMRNFPAEPELRSREQAARRLLANLLDWHRREIKADWWEYFRLKDLTDEDLVAERSAISDLTFVARIEVVQQDADRFV